MNIIEMAMAAKMAGGNGGGTGPIDPKRLPEGYPYKEKSETVVFEEHAFEMTYQDAFGYSNGHPNHGDLDRPVLTIGETYNVIICGEKHKCVLQEFNSGNGIFGNRWIVALAFGLTKEEALAAGYADTGEKFMVVYDAGSKSFTSVTVEGVFETGTLSITQDTETIYPIDSEYLKLGNGLTVDENGAIALSLPNAEGGSF